MKVTSIETLHCDAGWRNFSFVKLTSDTGLVGWSEFQEGFGSPGVTAAIEGLKPVVLGKDPRHTETIYWDLYAATRPAAGGIAGEAVAAVENALLEPLAQACAEERRHELLLIVARPNVPAGTGSPANPLAVC